MKLLQAGLAWGRKAMRRVLHRQLPGEAIETLGRYQIGRALGQGAMGTVYHVRDTLAPVGVEGRELALKLITARGGVTPELRLRFKEEFRAMVRPLHAPPTLARKLEPDHRMATRSRPLSKPDFSAL